MAQSSKLALGQVVRDLRERTGLTQEELGRAAGYRTGAGVSISRLESGLLRPSPERFAGVAGALGITPDELETRALAATGDDEAAARPPAANGHAVAAPGRAKAPPGQRELNARKERIEHEIGERTKVITACSEAFNTQHDRAQVDFALRVARIADRVAGAPRPSATLLQGGDATGADGTGGDQSSGLADGGVAVAPAGRGLAARAAVGTAVLAGIVALPVVALFAGGVMIKRNRTQRREYATQLDAADAELAVTAPGVTALVDILRRAAETLAYIATHGGHAVGRWEDQLGPSPTTWDALGPNRQERYLDFLQIAKAQDLIASFDFPAILTARGPAQYELIAHADQLLTASDAAVRARV